MHLDFFCALSLAMFASAAFDVEGESAWFVAANFCFSSYGEELADEVEDACVCGGV